MKKQTKLLSLLLTFLFICGCDNQNDTSTSEPIKEESSSAVSSTIESSSSIEVIKNYSFSVNSKATLDSETNNTYNIETNRILNENSCNEGTLSYKSLNEQVATVDANGQVSYVSCGRCKIEVTWTVESNEFKDYVAIDCYEKISLANINTFKQDYVTTQGRVRTGTSGLILNNSASGLDFAFKGSELKLKIKGSSNKSYIHIYVDDDKDGQLIKINSTKEKEYTICEGLEDTFHKITIIKATSSQYGTIYLNGFTSDVTYYKAPEKELTIEFLGDSISCGYGNLGNSAVAASSDNQDAGQAFPYLTASQLDSNYSVFALEGICVKDGATNIYDSYLKYFITDSNSNYDPTSYDADIVVIGLGENDMWHATASQFSYTVERFKSDYASLINLVREYHPNAHIICMYGMMSASSTTEASKAIEDAIKISNDRNISTLKVKKNVDGSETHPNVKGHKSFANQLVSKINDYLNK